MCTIYQIKVYSFQRFKPLVSGHSYKEIWPFYQRLAVLSRVMRRIAISTDFQVHIKTSFGTELDFEKAVTVESSKVAI